MLVEAHVGSGGLAPLQLLPATVAGMLYALRVHTLRDTSRAVPGWRQGCFYAGVFAIIFALASPLGHMAEELFLAHMVEHLLLADVGALLLVLGLTGPVIAPVLRIHGLHWLRVLGHPGVALALWTVNLAFWHIPAFHEAALRHEAIHALQHAGFVAGAFGVWMALLGPLPTPAWFGNGAKVGYIVAVRMVGAVLANVFVFGGVPFYGFYAPGEAYWGIAPAADQVTAGTIMMVWESVLTLGLFCWIFLKTAREGEERQALLDLARQRGVPLTTARAARAVGAGRGAELRARIEREPVALADRPCGSDAGAERHAHVSPLCVDPGDPEPHGPHPVPGQPLGRAAHADADHTAVATLHPHRETERAGPARDPSA